MTKEGGIMVIDQLWSSTLHQFYQITMNIKNKNQPLSHTYR